MTQYVLAGNVGAGARVAPDQNGSAFRSKKGADLAMMPVHWLTRR
jgi:hypothetical protein